MSRTNAEILSVMQDQEAAETSLAEINNTSQTGRWKAIKYVVAKAIELLDLSFDSHKSEVNQIVDKERYGQIGWYEKMGLLYQHGRNLIEGYDYYDNSSLVESEIEAERIVKFCAAKETPDGQIIIKVAKGITGAIEALTTFELAGIQSYFNRIKPAGVRIVCISLSADLLKVIFNIQYDALILNSEGKRLDNPDVEAPAITAINKYLSSINFAGEYSNMRLVDELQKIEGIIIPDVYASFAKYSDFDYVLIQSRYEPESGFMSFDINNSTLNYIPYPYV